MTLSRWHSKLWQVLLDCNRVFLFFTPITADSLSGRDAPSLNDGARYLREGAWTYEICLEWTEHMKYVWNDQKVWNMLGMTRTYEICLEWPEHMKYVWNDQNIWNMFGMIRTYEICLEWPEHMKYVWNDQNLRNMFGMTITWNMFGMTRTWNMFGMTRTSSFVHR